MFAHVIPILDVTKYRPEDHRERVLQVSTLMDSTDPDLSRFRAHGGKLGVVILEHMADYAQSPYAGIRYFESSRAKRLGKSETAEFARLYTAPGVDHVGAGAPANVDMLSVLVDWVEKGKPPGDLDITEQKVEGAQFRNRARAAVVPMAGLAALQGGTCQRLRRASSARGKSRSLCVGFVFIMRGL